MRMTVNAVDYSLDVEAVIAALHGLAPEEIHTHWVEVEGVRFPIKQALEAVLGIDRVEFTSQTARRQFRRLGLPTSGSDATRRTAMLKEKDSAPPPVSAAQAAEAFGTLVEFLRQESFTTAIARLEHALLGADRDTIGNVTASAGLTVPLLRAALVVRRDVGRVSDVIHAAAIVLALPALLEPGEIVSNRPSLGPGNDKLRPFDLETNRRVAEFKVALWSGGDMMRKRGVTADLVHLSLDDSGRRPELWVAGDEPIRFLQSSSSAVGDLLSRAPRRLRDRFTARYGIEPIPLRVFVEEHAGRVELHNIADVLPDVGRSAL